MPEQKGGVFFNEIKKILTFERFGVSIVPTAKDSQTEEWNGYGRLLFTEVSRKVFNTSRNPTMEEVSLLTNEVPLEEPNMSEALKHRFYLLVAVGPLVVLALCLVINLPLT